MNIFRGNLDKQVEHELYLCERELLEAEGALESWESKVAMLRARRARLLKRQGVVVQNAKFSESHPGIDLATYGR